MRSTDHHSSFTRLVDLVDGRLNANAKKQVQAHIAGCRRCAAEVDWLERAIGLMRTDRSEDLPAHVIAQVVDLFRSRNKLDLPRRPQRLIGVLRFDSDRLALVPGLRSRAPLERQLMFAAGGFNLDLRMLPAGSQWLIFGQVFGAVGRGRVKLQGPAGEAQTDLNDLYEFRLPPMPAGRYGLTLYLENADVEIAGLEVGV